jgi:DNA-binding beta-propeller fold protein YncE
MRMERVALAAFTVSLIVTTASPTPVFAAGGDELWVQRYDGPAHNWDAFTQLAISPDGTRVFVTGQSYSNETSYDIETIAYDSGSGAELWESRFAEAGHGRAEDSTGIAVSPDGRRLFVTGFSYWPGTTDDLVTVAYDAATGALMWTRVVGDLQNAYSGRAVSISPDGGTVFVTGTAVLPDDNVNVLTMAFDAEDGATRWIRSFDRPDHDSDIATAMAISPDGSRLFVVGQSGTINVDVDWLVLSYDASNGGLGWHRMIDGPGHAVDIPFSVAVSPQGNQVFVAGLVGVQDGQVGATVALDAESGSTRWMRLLTGLTIGFGSANSVVTNPDGSQVFVTADLPGVDLHDTMVTAAYDTSTGHQVWKEPYVGPFGDGAFGADLVVSPDGLKLYVSGTEYGPYDDDYATVAYVAGSGRRLWSARYDGPTHSLDEASSVAVSPDGSRVFVTGNSVGSVWPDYDFATVAYEA